MTRRIWHDRWPDSGTIFDGLAAAYDRYRPRYAAPSLARLAAYAGPVRRVVDVASGTGILTRALARTFPQALVVGAEPGRDMLAIASESDASCRSMPWLGCRAEALPLADGSLDLVAVGQALHWFDRQVFYRQCRRVLRPAGTLAVFYNNRIAGTPVARAHETALERLAPGYWRGYRDFDGKGELEACAGAFDVERHRHRWCWRPSAAAFVGYVRSTSHYKAALAGLSEERLLRALEEAIAPFADADGVVAVPYETVLTVARFA